MDTPIYLSDINSMEDDLKKWLDEDRKRKVVNDIKCDALYTAKTYEEFSDRVAAAHLKPLEKKDAITQKTKSGWNNIAD